MSAKKEVNCLLMQAAKRLLGHQPSAQEETRWRLLQAATEVFAEVGYHAATTREICKRAEVNLASIHYYYGDKAELYREVFRLPFLSDCNLFATLDISKVSLEEGLHVFYQWFFPTVSEEDPMLKLFMRLHAREDAEPSGVLGDAMMQAFRPNHERIQALLCRELGLKKPDTDADRLTFAVIGLATAYFHNHTALDYFAPNLIKGQKARETMAERLVGYAVALIESERKRRATAARAKK
jgi:AcrR family transcriptional regulator